MLKFRNYILAFLIIIISVFNIIYGGITTVISIMDNNNAVSQEVTICARDLGKNLNLTNGKSELYYTYFYCDNNKAGSPIVAKAKFMVTKKNNLDDFQKSDIVTIKYYKHAGYVLSMENENNIEVSNEEVKWYYLLISFLLPTLMIVFNKKNIIKTQKKKLSEEEEYALFLLGKKVQQDEPETFFDNLKQEWSNITKMFKRNQKDDK